MSYYDYHTHTSFSDDCTYPMETQILHAIQHNFIKLCFTDHYDYDYPSTPDLTFDIDLPNYFKTFLELKEKYKDKIQLLFGIELGLQPHIYDTVNKVINDYPFDFVIASTHVVDKVDPYFGSYYLNKTKKEAYSRYLEDILYNVTNYDNYNVYGHLDYIIRYGHYEDKKLYYYNYSELIDKILMQIIETGHGIELNTSGYRKDLNEPHPNTEIIQRYRQLGGEIITIGSDAHFPKHLAYNFDMAYNVLKECGFKYFTVFEQRKPEFIKIPD